MEQKRKNQTMHNSNLRRNNKVLLALTKVLPLIGIKNYSKAFAFETVGKTGVLLSTSWGAGAKKLREVLVPMEGKKNLTDDSFLLNLKPHHLDADVSSSFASFKLALQTL